MHTPGTLRIVIADGGRARFVTASRAHAPRTEHSLESPTIHEQTHDLVADRAGRSFESATPARHGIASRHDPHEAEKQKFAHLIADRVRAIAASHPSDSLVLVAPPRFLAELQDCLDPQTRARVIGTLDKDLVKVPDSELQPHLQEWIQLPARTP